MDRAGERARAVASLIVSYSSALSSSFSFLHSLSLSLPRGLSRASCMLHGASGDRVAAMAVAAPLPQQIELDVESRLFSVVRRTHQGGQMDGADGMTIHVFRGLSHSQSVPVPVPV